MLGIEHVVFRPEIREEAPGDDPRRMVCYLSRLKAEAALGHVEGGLVLAADTIVVQGGLIIGKPASGEEAREALRRLSGRWHEVHTGVVLMQEETGRTLEGVETTRVKFRELFDGEIDRYIGSGEPLDKAGAYGIQGMGSALVERIDGCYYNVVGMPLNMLLGMFREFGYSYGFPGLYRSSGKAGHL
jgi:septum formation protein